MSAALTIAMALAPIVPDIVRWVSGGDSKAAKAAEAVAGVAEAITGKSGMDAVTAIRADPALMIQFQQRVLEVNAQLEADRLKDIQAEHHEQQETIRNGDNAEDEYVRRTRPRMARQSWYAMLAYILGFEGLRAYLEVTNRTGGGADIEVALVLGSLALAYMGFRSIFDKFGLTGRVGRMFSRGARSTPA